MAPNVIEIANTFVARCYASGAAGRYRAESVRASTYLDPWLFREANGMVDEQVRTNNPIHRIKGRASAGRCSSRS